MRVLPYCDHPLVGLVCGFGFQSASEEHKAIPVASPHRPYQQKVVCPWPASNVLLVHGLFPLLPGRQEPTLCLPFDAPVQSALSMSLVNRSRPRVGASLAHCTRT